MSIMMMSSNGNISALLAFVRGIHRPQVDSLHKGQWRGALMFPLIRAWTDGWANNWGAGDLIPSRPLWRHCNVNENIDTRRWLLWVWPFQKDGRVGFGTLVHRNRKNPENDAPRGYPEIRCQHILRPGDAYMRQWTGSPLAQVLAPLSFCLKSGNGISNTSSPVLKYCPLDNKVQTSVKL